MSERRLNYQGEILTGRNFKRSILEGANFEEADLTNANFTDAILIGANFVYAHLTNANFTDANLTNANLRDADLAGANLTDAILEDADLTNANLTDAYLEGADLAGADLDRAFLFHANFEEANLYHANLEGADLSEANLGGAVLRGADFSYADLLNTSLEDADLEEANFTDATLTGAYLNDASLQRANFQDAFLITTSLQNADLREANFRNANLTDANLINTNLTGANFTGANLTNITIDDTTHGDVIYDNVTINIHELLQRWGEIQAKQPPQPPEPPQVRQQPVGRAYEVHVAFDNFTPFIKKYLDFINQPDKDYGDIYTYNKDKFTQNISELFPNDNEKLDQLTNILNSINGAIPENNKDIVGKSIDFAFSQNDDFKKQYIITYLDETCNAYGSGNRSCVKGMIERFVLSVLAVAEILCKEENDVICDEIYKNLYNISKFKLNALFKEWYNIVVQDNSIKSLNEEDKKRNLMEYLENKARELNLYNEDLQTFIQNYLNEIHMEDYDFEQVIGGKKHKKTIKKHKKTDKKYKKTNKKPKRLLKTSKKSKKHKRTFKKKN